MDRNIPKALQKSNMRTVALRKESVDRNSCGDTLRPPALVALRKESVDRNYYANRDADWVRVSLSARRAWIEMVLWYIDWAFL